MAVIGTLGKSIVFEVSDQKVLLLQSLSREVKGRWTTHEAVGAKPQAEFLGADNQSISLSIHLSASLGVKPRAVLEAIAAMAEKGEAEYLVIGSRPVGKRPFRIVSVSESWDTLYSRGELARATLSLNLEEYN